MTWTDAQNQLMDDLAALGPPVHLTPPQTIDDEVIHVYIVPPAREVDRRASHVRRTKYDQAIVVMKHVPNEGDQDIDAIAQAVDEHVENINDALDRDLQLGGYATSVTPPGWDQLGVVEWPAGTGVLYVQMAGRIEIEVEAITTFGPVAPVNGLALEGMGHLLIEDGETLILEA